MTGNGKSFSVGSDVNEMSKWKSEDIKNKGYFSEWYNLKDIKKPIIAAVNGAALGAGCELAMMCDIIIASKKAYFGQPEVKLGLIPGMGGTQRLIRLLGQSKAMEMVLTGKTKVF